ncbi:MAG: SLC13 family permease [Gammaproteobacteria bacterium]|nr:SLC13 family permease [Gammaproteobacteria bacterium]
MSIDQMIMLALLSGALCLFVWGHWRYDLIAFSVLLLAVVFGLVDPMAAFQGFGHPAVITVATVLVLSRALSKSALIALLSRHLERYSGQRMPVQIGALSGISSVLSAFINNVGALALFMPVALRVARRAEHAPGLVLMPLAFATILGGLITLIGTPPNIIVSAYRAEVTGEYFAMFDYAPVGLPVALAGVVFVTFFGWRLIPRARREGGTTPRIIEIDDYVTELRIPENSTLIGKGPRQIRTIFDAQHAKLLGLIRDNQKVQLATWRGRVKLGDILVIGAAPEEISETIQALGLELVGAGPSDAKADSARGLAFIEAVVSPEGLLAGRTAEGVCLRSRYGLDLLAVSRQGRRIRGRLHTVRFRAGDVLLIQGPESEITEILALLGCLPLLDRGLIISSTGNAWVPVVLFASAIAAASIGVVTPPIALSIAAVAMLFLKVISLREAYDSINWPVIVLLGSMIPIGGALETTGTTGLITGTMLGLGTALSPVLILVLVMVITMTLSDIVNNAATAVIMAPIALDLAERLEINADPFLMAVAIGASCAFLTPIGHQNNMLVMGPGGYRFGDYWRMGLPLELLIIALSIPLILIVWPL